MDAFFEVMSLISAGKRYTRDLYALQSLHFEKLKGIKKDIRSLRLNKQWRLSMRLEKDECDEYLLILNIEDYHS